MQKVPSVCPSTSPAQALPPHKEGRSLPQHNEAPVDLPRLENPLKSLSESIFSRETLVGHHLALCGRGETRAPRGTPASNRPPISAGHRAGGAPSPHGTPPQNTHPAAPPPTACKPAPRLFTFSTPSWAHPSTSPPEPGGQRRGFPGGERPWPRASPRGRRRRRPRGLTLHPAEFSLSRLQAAKFARRFFPAVFLHTTGPKKSCTEISLYRWL